MSCACGCGEETTTYRGEPRRYIAGHHSLSLAQNPASRVCSKCHIEKPIDEFYAHGQREGRHRPDCKTCHNIRAKIRQDRSRYGLEPNEVKEMFLRADNSCEICGGRPIKLCIDHKGSVIRGILCDPCNIGLGMFRDNPILMRNAIDYLKRTGHALKGIIALAANVKGELS